VSFSGREKEGTGSRLLSCKVEGQAVKEKKTFVGLLQPVLIVASVEFPISIHRS
jgi:hypothetical protein